MKVKKRKKIKMTDGPLSSLVIVDLGHRLPGPLATHILQTLGAKVIKVEDKKFSDPFKQGLFKEIDPSFPIWYEELNKSKDIQMFDFNDLQDQIKIQTLIKESDACLLGIPEKIQLKLGIDKEFKKSLSKPFVFISTRAQKENDEALHDLNAMAQIGLIDLFLAQKNEKRVDPPFLPLAGIIFGQQIATELLACYIQSERQGIIVENSVFLKQAAERVLTPFWSQKLRETGQTKFLHNGLYPCYSLYKTKDAGYVGLAAVEEKFWIRFCQLFELPFSAQDRFKHDSEDVFSSLESLFSSRTTKEIEQLTENENICLSIIY
jgi:alpha-methylacyl-CoA racemase